MRNIFVRVALCFTCVLAASHCGDDDDATVNAAGSGGGSGRSGSGGGTTGGEQGTETGGANAGAGGEAKAGASGSAAGRGAGNAGRGGGSMGVAGSGDELDGGAEDAGPIAGAAASGSAGSGGSAGGEDQAATQCLDDAMADGQTITDCERCLCQTGVCQTEMNAIKGDVNANALVKCSQQNMCSGQCCVCGQTCGLQNYGDGPCAAEAKTAAGESPSSGLEGALTVMQQCAESGPEDSACTRAARLSACALSKCAAMCPNLPACQ